MSVMKKQMKANPQTPGNTQSGTYENTEEKVTIMKMKQELLQRKSTSSLRTTSKVRKRKNFRNNLRRAN
jgi:hypothetical protein